MAEVVNTIRSVAHLFLLTMGVLMLSLIAALYFFLHSSVSFEIFPMQSEKYEVEEIPAQALLALRPVGNLIDHIDDEGELAQQLRELTGAGSRGNNSSNSTDAHEFIRVLDRASKDDRIQGAVLDLSMFWGGRPALLDAVADAMLRFRNSGKHILTTSEYLDQPAYYLAAHSDVVFLDDMGAVAIEGFGIHSLFFADALEKLKLKVHAFVAGEYKSAPEIFTSNTMSEESRSSGNRWTGKLWQSWKDRVATHANLKPELLQSYANFPNRYIAQAKGNLAEAAHNLNLVQATYELAGMSLEEMPAFYRIAQEDHLQQPQDETQTQPQDEMHAQPQAQPQELDDSGAEETADREANLEAIHWLDYLRVLDTAERGDDGDMRSQDNDKPRIAVLFASGQVSFEDSEDSFDAQRLADAILDQADSSEPPSAIVLRIDSPGGSIFASEVIRRAIAQAQETVPIVASIGGLGASGGYYLATAADQIWAGQNSITGSIGVFALIMTAEGTIESLGIHYDGTGTSDLSGARTPFSPLHPRLAEVLDSSVGYAYQHFMTLVARSRNMTLREVQKIAGGQVWLGSEAREHGLLDGLGNLDDAIVAAADLAELGEGDYWVDFVSEKDDFFDNLVGFFRSEQMIVRDWVQFLPPVVRAQIAQLLRQPDPQHLYMSCLQCGSADSFKTAPAAAISLPKLP